MGHKKNHFLVNQAGDVQEILGTDRFEDVRSENQIHEIDPDSSRLGLVKAKELNALIDRGVNKDPPAPLP